MIENIFCILLGVLFTAVSIISALNGAYQNALLSFIIVLLLVIKMDIGKIK